jgi:hypothetical protein
MGGSRQLWWGWSILVRKWPSLTESEGRKNCGTTKLIAMLGHVLIRSEGRKRVAIWTARYISACVVGA